MYKNCSFEEPIETSQVAIERTVDLIATYQDLDGWKYLAKLRVEIQRWGSIWGGITCWPESLEVMFLGACRTGHESVMELSYEVWRHADAGRLLLREIERMDGKLPDNPYALKMLWNEYSTLHHLLIRGITIIEARMNALNPGIFRLPGTPCDDEDTDLEEENGVEDDDEL
jgi:hypothetical protein